MSVEPHPRSGDDAGAVLIRRVAVADAREAVRLSATIDDFFRPSVARIDDRTRYALEASFAGIVDTIDTALRDHATRMLAAHGAMPLATPLAGDSVVVARLRDARVIRTGDVMQMLLGRTSLDAMADRLASVATTQDGASLLSRLVDCPDARIAAAASDLLALEARRRESGVAAHSELPAELYHQLVWQVAAAIRADVGPSPDRDRALSDAAWQVIAAYDEGDRVEAAATRLAGAIDALPDEWSALMLEALGDRRPALFVAVLAQACALDYDQARSVVVDPVDERLLCLLRAIALDRRTIARIGVALAQADPRRDIDGLADRIDAVMAVSVDDCAVAIAPLCLDRDFRQAIRAIGAA